MSDIPELDRLIEESENIRRNIKWRREDRFFKSFFVSAFRLLVLFFLAFLAFVSSTTAISFVALVIAAPFIYKAYYDITTELLRDDWEGVDMTKRYYRK